MPESSVLCGFESRDSLAVISEHDAFDAIQLRVEPIERRVHAVERARDPKGLQTCERRERGNDRRGLRPFHARIVPAVPVLGKASVEGVSVVAERGFATMTARGVGSRLRVAVIETVSRPE